MIIYVMIYIYIDVNLYGKNYKLLYLNLLYF